MEIFYPTKKEFQKTVESAFERIMANRLPELIRKATEKKYYTIDETCELLDCTRRHLQYLRSTGQINFIKNGRKVYFRREDLEKFFDSNYIETQSA